MYVRVRIKLRTGKLTMLRADLPSDIRDFNADTIDDAVSDWLSENKISYKWYRIDSLIKE